MLVVIFRRFIKFLENVLKEKNIFLNAQPLNLFLCVLSYLDRFSFQHTAPSIISFAKFTPKFRHTLRGLTKSQSVKPICIVLHPPPFFFLFSFVDPPSLSHTSDIFGSLVSHRSSCPFTWRLEDINIHARVFLLIYFRFFCQAESSSLIAPQRLMMMMMGSYKRWEISLRKSLQFKRNKKPVECWSHFFLLFP